MTERRLILTVDVEDWAQASWDRGLELTQRSADQARRLLELFAGFPAARATFFVLGKFAERHPRVVEEIARAGHEVACHGYSHVELFRLGPDGFAEDLRRSTELVAMVSGVQPKGFRAPDFSIVGESLWALELLADAGYEYDSSIFPISKARYGIPGWPSGPVSVVLRDGRRIVEVPLATISAGRHRLPVGGGGYARLLPRAILVHALRRAAQETGCPPVFYCHPYELDAAELDNVAVDLPLRVKLHQGIGRKGTVRKLSSLLKNFSCISAEQFLATAPLLAAARYEQHQLEGDVTTRPPIF